MDKASELTTDSKRLIFLLKHGKADIAVNWYAPSVWPENIDHVDALRISNEYAAKKKLMLGLLKTSKYPEIAKSFMQYASSEKGKVIFDKYGLYNVK